MSFLNKRKHERFVTDLIFMYEIETKPDGQEELHSIGTAVIKNISLGGVKIAYHQQLPVDTNLKITLVPFTNMDLKITARGTIRWVHQAGEELYFCGVQFVSFDGESQKILAQYIDYLKDNPPQEPEIDEQSIPEIP